MDSVHISIERMAGRFSLPGFTIMIWLDTVKEWIYHKGKPLDNKEMALFTRISFLMKRKNLRI